jgi:hypothetical protein
MALACAPSFASMIGLGQSSGGPYPCANVFPTPTPNLQLNLIATNACNWGTYLNSNSTILDTLLAGYEASHIRVGDIAWWNGTQWEFLAGNNSGTQFLSESSGGIPGWSSSTTTPGGSSGQIQFNNAGAFGGITTTGTGLAVLATGPVMTLTSATGLPLASGVTGTLPIGNGGTNATTAAGALINLYPTPTRAGDIAYWNGSNFILLAGNNSGSACFAESAGGVPSWVTCGSGGLPSGSGIVQVTSGTGGLVTIGPTGGLSYNTGTGVLDLVSSVVALFGNAWNVPNLVTFTQQPNSATNCASSASPAVCGSSWAGRVAVAAAATTVVVDTTAVTANSEIHLQWDSSLGSALSVTCNTTQSLAQVSAKTAATSFTITLASAPSTNPACLDFTITN